MNATIKSFALIAVAATGVAHGYPAFTDFTTHVENTWSPTDFLLSYRHAAGSVVEPNGWYGRLSDCKTYCEREGIPLVAVWSNGDKCGHCLRLEHNANSIAFRQWASKSGVVFYFGYFGDPYPENTLGPSCVWTAGGNTGKTLPFVRIWWPKGGVDVLTDGDTWDGFYGRWGGDNNRTDPSQFLYPGDYDTFNQGGRYMAYYLTNAVNGVLRNYKPAGAYAGGEFMTVDSPNAGLQVIAGETKRLMIPFSRTNLTSQAKAYTNMVWGVYPDNTSFTNYLTWAAGDVRQMLPIDITKNGRVTEGDAGKTIRVCLYDDKKKLVAENKVYCVAAKDHPNGIANPYWIGERTADTLEWGEWTMDLDAVTNKVANWKRTVGTKAFALVAVAGSQWCKDCAMAERHFYDTTNFTAWAKKNRVALGVVDIPKDPSLASSYLASPSLLTYTTGRSSDDYVTCGGTCPADETKRIASGAPYISRHGIEIDPATGLDVKKIAARNSKLVSRNTLNGGWNRPERVNQARTGVPIVIALREDGSIIGRWNAFSDQGPSAWDDAYLRRLEELLSRNDPAEEANDNWRTTQEKIVRRASTAASATLSHVDLVDSYLIDPTAVGQTVSFKASAAVDVQVSLSIVQASPSLEKTLASASGSIMNQLEVSALIPSTNCYLVVAIEPVSSGKPSTPVSPAVAANCKDSTVFAYVVSSDNVLVPAETAKTERVTDGKPFVTITTVKGTSYKISNLAESVVEEGLFVKGAGEDVYIAQHDGSTTLTLKEADVGSSPVTYSTTYQIWNTGKIGFETGSDSVSEPSAAPYGYQIRIVRTGGSAGLAKASVYLDRDDPRTAWIDRLEEVGNGAVETVYRWEDDGAEVVWKEGETDAKTFTVFVNPNEYADGDQQLVFRLRKGESDADLATAELVLTIKDDDRPSAGTLALAGTAPVCQKQMTLFAKAGSEIELSVARLNGADGEVAAELQATAGSFEDGADLCRFVWGTRDAAVRTVRLKLPEAVTEEDILVTLTSFNGAKTDPDRKVLRIKLTCTDGLTFESGTLESGACRYLPLGTLKVGVSDAPGVVWDQVSVAKCSGSLPPGVTFAYDSEAHEVVIGGVPAVAGDYRAFYQIWHGETPGGTLMVRISVADPAAASLSSSALNDSIVNLRVYSDILVANVTKQKMAGVLTLSIPRSGRLSAKYQSVTGETVSYLSTCWSDFDASFAYVAELHAVTTGFAAETFTVRANPDGTVEVSGFRDPSSPGDEYVCHVPNATDFAARNWAGYYTVNLANTNEVSADSRPFASGDAYMTLKMNDDDAVAARKVVYAGMLPNGKAFSGTAVLQADGASYDVDAGEYGRALLPIVTVSTTDALTGVVSIKPYARDEHKNSRRSVYASDDMKLVWAHREAVDELSHDVSLEAFGTYYDQTESLQECCEGGSLGTNKLSFFVIPEKLRLDTNFAVDETPVSWDKTGADVGVAYANGVNRLGLWDSATSGLRHGLTMSANLETGTVSGKANLEFPSGVVAVTWRGVILPGWGSGCGECSLGNADAVARPFIGGACWFTDAYHYIDAKGRARSLSVKRGCPISVGINPGE